MRRPVMAESVAELLGRLRFVGGPVETLYLNQPRVRESFIGQLGAIESFTRSSAKEGSVGVPVVKIGADLTAESDGASAASIHSSSIAAAPSFRDQARSDGG